MLLSIVSVCSNSIISRYKVSSKLGVRYNQSYAKIKGVRRKKQQENDHAKTERRGKMSAFATKYRQEMDADKLLIYLQRIYCARVFVCLYCLYKTVQIYNLYILQQLWV